MNTVLLHKGKKFLAVRTNLSYRLKVGFVKGAK